MLKSAHRIVYKSQTFDPRHYQSFTDFAFIKNIFGGKFVNESWGSRRVTNCRARGSFMLWKLGSTGKELASKQFVRRLHTE